ncbi:MULTISPECIES: nucleotidyltransferase domain-containing protein [Pontibacillus]|uniref:Nucleotidyltransferase domain-containing protein n=1 Tax=Pontibacillus chungwhensis TaxID=265426 RepID=A0ABY8V0T8_9BACI|nr:MULTISPECIES: nucleotidyltransferase domain-containing protein [Pontibacillus]MCD5324886.1 nucleotidyltransferase domain-containing protein [Pontibacillus sp. HN14]WIF98847.1 nucleotidyltransferase domain-containing protein [Pontibacillus chungwhensis]
MIGEQLRAIEEEYEVKVLYACEAGSRAYGISSEMSDYDVRFIYVHKEDWYLSIDEKRDVIEKPLSEQLDLSGWELKKALKLLRKSNPSMLEWLYSEQVYMEQEGFMDRLRRIMPSAFNPLSVLHHYHKMAKRNHKELGKGSQVQVKRYINVFRPLLMCRWVLSYHEFPPLPLSKLLQDESVPVEIKSQMNDVLSEKMKAPDVSYMERMKDLDQYIQTEFHQIEQELSNIQPPSHSVTRELDELFRFTVRHIHTS